MKNDHYCVERGRHKKRRHPFLLSFIFNHCQTTFHLLFLFQGLKVLATTSMGNVLHILTVDWDKIVLSSE